MINRNHSRYLGGLSLDEAVERLLNGNGVLGSCREYLENTVEHLDKMKVEGAYLRKLHKLVRIKSRELEPTAENQS